MTENKRYGILLNDFAVAEIGKLLSQWSQSNEYGTYLLAKSVDPNGAFVHVVIADKPPPGVGPVPDIELQIPHAFIKAIIYAADIKRLGFVAV